MAAAVEPEQRAGALTGDALMHPWFAALRPYLGDIRLFDAHTHLGCGDPDGSCFGAAELRAALGVVDARGVVFPLAEPGTYAAANDRMLAAAELAHGRLVPFCRVDPRNGGLHEAERAVGLGAAGIKLHPRAERFRLGDPDVREILAFADERRLPIIVHAGRGIPSLGRDALALARVYPGAPIILAHASITDLAWIWREAAGQRNLFFDTAWWNTADQLALFSLIPPGQILFASDTPYGRTVAAAAVVLRAALAAGLSREQIAYAALDTRFLLPLHALLAGELEGRGAAEEARREFDRIASVEPRERVFDREGWRRLKGARELDPPGREVLRALWLAREEAARASDRPPFKVMAEQAMVEVARRRPRGAEALARVPGVTPPVLRRLGDAMIAAIEATAA